MKQHTRDEPDEDTWTTRGQERKVGVALPRPRPVSQAAPRSSVQVRNVQRQNVGKKDFPKTLTFYDQFGYYIPTLLTLPDSTPHV
jgi:hypothetical protein